MPVADINATRRIAPETVDLIGTAPLTLSLVVRMPYLIRAACLSDYVEVARSVGLEPNHMIDAVGLPQTSPRNPELKISLAAFILSVDLTLR